MARIIYGVAGEGFGHSSRSELIGQWLMDAGHEVKFVASRKSLAYLSRRFGTAVKEIFGLRLVYEQGVLRPGLTVAANAREVGRGSLLTAALFREEFEPFCPDLVISDYEPFSSWWAWRHGVPCVTIDHQHVLTLCELAEPPGEWASRSMARLTTRCYHPRVHNAIVLNFFKAPLRHPGAVLAPPVVRSALASLTPSAGEHVLIYSTDSHPGTGRRLEAVLARFPRQPFIVYGFDREQQVGHCTYKRPSKEGFLADLASARAVVATAGFSLISECLYFNKRMLLMPVQGQYEQMLNAHYVQRLGIGQTIRSLTSENLGSFLDYLTQPRELSADILYPDNDLCLALIERVLCRVGVARPAHSQKVCLEVP
jgi:uncharacterized protein (TIGR00661 family)